MNLMLKLLKINAYVMQADIPTIQLSMQMTHDKDSFRTRQCKTRI